MSIRKFFISLFLLAILALTFVACSGTKNICPAYTSVEAEMSVKPNG
jgi:hypothetical protein